VQFRKFVFLSILSLSLALVFLPNHRTTHAAGPWFVSPAGNDGNDCLSVGTACLTIQAAVNKASPGDIVNVAAGHSDRAWTNRQDRSVTQTSCGECPGDRC